MKYMIFLVCFCINGVLGQAQDADKPITHDQIHNLFTTYQALYDDDSGYESTAFRNLVAKYYLKYLSNYLVNMTTEERDKVNWDHPDAPHLVALLSDVLKNHYLGFDADGAMENAFFEMDSIVWQGEGEMHITIPYGSFDGITDSAKGWAWTVYNSGDKSEARASNSFLGYARVTKRGTFSTTLSIQLDETSEYLPQMGDNIELRIPGRSQAAYTLLDELTDFNINFQNLYGQPITIRSLFRQIDMKQAQSYLFEYMVADLRATGEMFADDASFKAYRVEGGRFDGMGLTDALQAASIVDLRMFLGFVRDFPGKYMGNNWKLNETFATWMINATPLESSASNWLIDSLVQLHQTAQFAPFVRTYAYYLGDSLQTDLLDQIDALISEQAYGRMRTVAEAWYAMGQILGDTSAMLSAIDNIGFSYQMDSAYFKAIEWHTKSIRLDESHMNAYWNRSNAYAGLEQYADAIADLEILFEYAPWFSTAPGNMGWYYMKQGEIEKSAPYIQKAFEMDSSVMAWNVNYGHLLLLTGKKKEAYQFYQRTLDLVQYETEFTEGPVGDFEIFLEKGWFKTEVLAAKAWMQDQYDRIYKHRVRSNAAFDSAKGYKEQDLWAKALIWYEKALAHELAGEQPRDWEVYLYEGWIGRCHQELEQYAAGVKAYQNALGAARKISTDEVVNSFELLGWIHREMGEATRSSSYYAEAKALERLQAEQSGSKDLYVIAIGVNTYPELEYQWAEQDATAVAQQFSGQATLLFDRVYTEVLTGSKANRQGIQKAFTHVIEHAKPGDTFICYWAGQVAENPEGYFMAADYGSDTTAVIPAILLNNWLTLTPATKQLVIIDASLPNFASDLTRLLSNDRDVDQANYQAVISPFGARRERDGMQHSLLTHFLVEGLSGSANPIIGADTMISVKELEAYVSGQLSKPQNYEQVLSYIQGIDFGLTYTAPLVALAVDTIPPEIEVRTPRLTRGGLTETQEATAIIEAKIFDGSGLKAVRLNRQPIAMEDGNVLETFVSLAIGANEFVIEAIDEFGNSATDTLIIKRVPQARNTATSSDRISFGTPKRRNIALFIASDSYQEWNDLNNPVRDARAIQKELATQYGFEVDTLFNPTKEQFEEKVYSYLEGNFNEEDRLFVFIAGHGVYDNIMQDGYLATYDSEKNAKRKEDSYIPLSWLSMKLDRCRFNKIFVMIDACFGGAFGDIQYANSGEKTRLYLTSGNKVYVDDGPAGGHSPFAYGILNVLRNQGRQLGQVSAMSFPVYLEQVEVLQTEPRFGAFASSSRDPEFTFEFAQPVSGVRSSSIDTGF